MLAGRGSPPHDGSPTEFNLPPRPSYVEISHRQFFQRSVNSSAVLFQLAYNYKAYSTEQRKFIQTETGCMFDPLKKITSFSSLCQKQKPIHEKRTAACCCIRKDEMGKGILFPRYPMPNYRNPLLHLSSSLFPNEPFFLLPPSPIPPSPSSFQHPIFIICCLLLHPPPPRNFTLSSISKVVSRTFCPSFKFIYLNIGSSVCQPFLKANHQCMSFFKGGHSFLLLFPDHFKQNCKHRRFPEEEENANEEKTSPPPPFSLNIRSQARHTVRYPHYTLPRKKRRH